MRQLQPAHIIPLPDIQHLRFLLSVSDEDADSPVEVDAIAFLLNEHGVVRGDQDMIFYGQPDHPSGAVTLAADDNGAPTAIHIRTDHIPTRDRRDAPHRTGQRLHTYSHQAIDIDIGTALGELALTTAGT